MPTVKNCPLFNDGLKPCQRNIFFSLNPTNPPAFGRASLLEPTVLDAKRLELFDFQTADSFNLFRGRRTSTHAPLGTSMPKSQFPMTATARFPAPELAQVFPGANGN